MTRSQQSTQWIVWGGLALIVVCILLSFLAQKGTTPTESAQSALPVIKQISAFGLTNQFGHSVTLSTLAGKPWLANIIFTRCPSICAQMTARMHEIQSKLPAESRANLVTVTTDPDNDTPQVLSRYATRHKADPNRWMFLTGTKPETQRVILKELMLAFQETPPEERTIENDLFIHSSLIVLVDSKGRLRNSYESLEPGAIEEILADLERLKKEES